MTYNAILKFARENRKNQTEAEQFFWKKVRNRNFCGLKFNRQFVVEYKLFNNISKYFIADFYCNEYKLIIELEGKIHDFNGNYDEDRNEILKLQGYMVIRFKNEDIVNKWDYIEMKIKEIIDN